MSSWKHEIGNHNKSVETLNIQGSNSHRICVCELLTEGSYLVYYYINSMVEIKEYIKAGDMEEAKSVALNMVKMRIRSHILYWERIRNAFESEVHSSEVVGR